MVAKLRAARERKIAAGGRGSGRFTYAQKVPEVVVLVRELHGQRQSLRQVSKTLASQGHLTGGAIHCDCGAEDAARRIGTRRVAVPFPAVRLNRVGCLSLTQRWPWIR